MAVSEAQKRAKKKYAETHLESIRFDVRKGKQAIYKAAAKARGLKFMPMIRTAIEEFIANHEAGTVVVPFEEPAEKNPSAGVELSAQEQLLLARFNRLPQATKDVVLDIVDEAARVANRGGAGNGD